MPTPQTAPSFPVDYDKLQRYIYWYGFWWTLLVFVLPTFGMGLPFWLVWVIGFCPWYARSYSQFYAASLEQKRIRINHGVVFQKRKAIPLDRVTDVLISQGFLERRMNIGQIRIQTAGTGVQGGAEGVILALPIDAVDDVQEQIIEARDRYSERSAE